MKKHLFTLAISYDIVTHESAENGDTREEGWEQEPTPASMRDCLQAVQNMGGIDWHDGDSFYPCDASIDYHTGEYRREYVHVRPMTDSAAKAWSKALKIAKITK
jgi:hypothetical protein